jgi:hypothetical protein
MARRSGRGAIPHDAAKPLTPLGAASGACSPTRGERTSGALFALGLALGLAATAPALADKVGVAAAVNPDAFSSLNGSPKTQLNIGKSIFYDEHINTTGSGLVQVLLIDGSTFTVGPGSDLTIDKFVYDPNKKTGEIVATFSKGAMRFIGGKLSKNEGGVTVNTPQGALAIRGGMFMGQITGPKSAIYSFLYGVSLTLAGHGTIFQPGNSFYVSGTGTDIKPTTADVINAMMAALTKAGSYNNAGTNPPTTPSPGQLVIQGNNYNEIISTATATQIQDQIQKQIDEFNNAPETPAEPGQPQQLTTLNSGYAGGSYYQYGDNRDPRSGTLTNLSPEEFLPLFDPNTQAFQGASMTVYVNSGAPGEGGAKMIFNPVPLPPETQNVPTPEGSVSLFVGYADQSSITIYDSTAQNPTKLTAPATNVVGYAVIRGLSGAGQVLCSSCDFLKWGAWLTEVSFDSYRNISASGFWVSGDIIKDTIGALPVTGGADYAGLAIGTVTTDLVDAGVPYVASGAATMHWDFGSRTGRFDVTGFDKGINGINPGTGISFGGNLSAPGITNAANQFGGSLSGQLAGNLPNCTNPELKGAVTGSFVKGPGQVAGNIPAAAIGNWAVSNGAKYNNYYSASGIFGVSRH